MTKSKKTLKTSDKEKLELLNIKVSAKVKKQLTSKAKKYADGNLSNWLRQAGLKYIPVAKSKV